MKTTLLCLTAVGCLVAQSSATPWTAGFQEGKPEFKSISQLAFGPEGILLAADSRAAAIVAIATGDTEKRATPSSVKIEDIKAKIAALLGTAADQIIIDDIAVNPISHRTYLAVSRGRGPEAVPVLLRINDGKDLEVVPLSKVRFSRSELPDAPADKVVGEGRRSNNPRMESITDIAFLENRVLVAGLSNEEFASTLRSIPFPFGKGVTGANVEIYHGAHGRFETRSPIRTFVPFNVGREPQLLAAYTCTPLVQLPLKDLLPGAKVKGKTIAELGNRNRPLDMIVYEKGGKEFLLLANSSRGVMKLSTDKIDGSESITEPVKDGTSKGLPYETLQGWTGVDQLDRLDPAHVVVLRRGEGSIQHLESLALP